MFKQIGTNSFNHSFLKKQLTNNENKEASMRNIRTILGLMALLIIACFVFLSIFSENFNQINSGVQGRQQAIETLAQAAR